MLQISASLLKVSEAARLKALNFAISRKLDPYSKHDLGIKKAHDKRILTIQNNLGK